MAEAAAKARSRIFRVIGLSAFLLAVATFRAFAGTGYAPFYDPRIEPANPAPNGEVEWIALWDGCGSLDTPVVVRTGANIDVQWPIHVLCGIPIGGIATVSLGRFPPGRYHVHVTPCAPLDGDRCFPFDAPPDVEFVVAGRGGAEVPALVRWAELALGIGLVSIGALAVGQRRASAKKRSSSRPDG